MLSIGAGGAQNSFQQFSFKGPDWVIKLSAEAKVKTSQKTGKTWIYFRIDRENPLCCDGVVTLAAHVVIAGHQVDFPVEVPGDGKTGNLRSEYNKELEEGTVDRFYFTLEQAKVWKDLGRTISVYRGPVIDDKACFADTVKASTLGGLVGRKMMRDLIETGCVSIVDEPMQFNPDVLLTIQGVKTYHAFLQSRKPDSLDYKIGYILAKDVTKVAIPESIPVPKGQLGEKSADVVLHPGGPQTDY